MTDKQQNHNSEGFQIIIQFIQTPLTQRDNWHDNNYYDTGVEIANVDFLRRYRTRTSKYKKREPTSFNKLYDS